MMGGEHRRTGSAQPRPAGPTMTPTTHGRRWHVQCAEHKLDRLVNTEAHALNLLALHERIDHATIVGPQTFDVAAAAGMVVVVHTDPYIAGHRTAVLSVWEALTGMSGDDALAYAHQCAATNERAALIPF